MYVIEICSQSFAEDSLRKQIVKWLADRVQFFKMQETLSGKVEMKSDGEEITTPTSQDYLHKVMSL